MNRRVRRIASGLAMLLLAGPLLAAAAIPQPSEPMTRAASKLNGVFSPRGFFNILVPLGKIQGVRAVKLDLKQSRIIIDFNPGVSVTESEIRKVMVEAGYKPGDVTLEQLAKSRVAETGPGWMKIKHPNSRNPFVRWVSENF